MDVVITYVNGLDPVWQKDYAEYVGGVVMEKRFRDWGTLRYLLRGIEQYMPFVNNVYLVVSGESQVPEWADKHNLKVVLHRDIIPEEHLPVFNSTAIEMFLHRIEGLDEEFVYFNDDFFPVKPCRPEDFFVDGKALIKHHRCLFAFGLFKKQVRNSDHLARSAAGAPRSLFFMRPQHISSPMLRSLSEELFAKKEKEILSSVTRLREDGNYNQYIFTDYLYFIGRTIHKKLSKRHFSMAVTSVDKVCRFLDNPDRQFMCVNDVKMSEEKYVNARRMLLDSFQRRLPERSRFETLI